MSNSLNSARYDNLRFWLKNIRKEKGLTLRDLAILTGTHHSVFGKVEQGRRRIDLIEFIDYCNVLNVDPNEGISYLGIGLYNPIR